MGIALRPSDRSRTQVLNLSPEAKVPEPWPESKAPVATGHRGGARHRPRHRAAAAGRWLARQRRRPARHRAFARLRQVAAHRDRSKATLPTSRPRGRRSRRSTEKFGRLDAVVSNAGIMVRKPISRAHADGMAQSHRHQPDRGLPARPRGRKAAARGAAARSSLIASTRALMSEPNTESYSATKGGLVALTHALAVSLGPDVRVNCVSPGWIVVRARRAGRVAAQGSRAASRRPRRQAQGHRRDRRLPAGRRARRLHHRRQFHRRRRHDAEDDLRGIAVRLIVL